MIVRFRTGADSEVNLIASNIASFRPGPTDATGAKSAVITMLNGQDYTVPFSCQAVRGAVKRAFAPAEDNSED